MATKKTVTKKKPKAPNRMTLISGRAKEIYAEGKTKKWTDAIKKASVELKKEGKI